MKLTITSSRQFQSMSPKRKWFFEKCFPWPFILLGATCLFFGVQGIFNAQASLNWLTTNGTIISASVESRRGNSRTIYHAEILYDYIINGTTYQCNRIAYGDYGSSNPAHAQSIVHKYHKRKKVIVYYSPSAPDEALLEVGLQGQAWFVPAFGALFLLAGIAMLIYIPKAFVAEE